MSKKLLTTMMLGLAMSSLTNVNVFDSSFYNSNGFPVPKKNYKKKNYKKKKKKKKK